MKFRCPVHGIVKPKTIMYSCPAQANCPVCHLDLEDLDGGIKMMSEKEGFLRRPGFYKDHYPEIYEKYKHLLEKGKKMFIAYLNQGDGGCDHTIGCAQEMVVLKSDDKESALAELKELIEEGYMHDQELSEATLYEVVEKTEIPIDDWYGEIEGENEKREAEKQERKDEAELERLKKKLGED